MQPDRGNLFGALRLFFAAAVVFSHSPELLGHPLNTEPFRYLFGTITLGDVSVDAFFIISGYLITKSYLSPQPLARYLLSRVLRIYPGYVVVFLLSFYLVGWLADGDISVGFGAGVFRQLLTMALLQWPDVPGAFPNQTWHVVNGPIWSLAQEFRCYMLVVIFGLAGILHRKPAVAAAVVVGLLCLTFHSFSFIRMASVFISGMGFYIFRDHIPYRWPLALAAAAAWAVLMRVPSLCEPATCLFGGYVIFWVAFNVRIPWLRRIGRHTDVSYGLYLYAWPIGNLLVRHDPAMSSLTLSLITVLLAAICGWLSWHLVEQPFLRLKDAPWLIEPLGRGLRLVRNRLPARMGA